MQNLAQLLEVIADPYSGREEGVDFWVDEDGYIQTQDARAAALIMREANKSGQFEQNLVKVGQKGDSILLGFDMLAEVDPVFTTHIGYKKSMLAEIKKDTSGKFCVYLDNKRMARMFAKLTSAKTFIKQHDKELQSMGETVATYEESDD